MNPKLNKILTDIGLSENQAQVYLGILELGASLVTEVAKKTGIKRTSVTNYIHELLDMGYLSQSLRGKRVVYLAESPESIAKNLEIKKQRFEEQIPELNNMFGGGSGKTNIRYFEGKAGLNQLYREVFNQFKPIQTFFSVEQYLKLFNIDDMNECVASLRAHNNTIIDLMEDTPFARKFMEPRKFEMKTFAWLPKKFKVSIDLMIYGDNVVMMSFTKQIGVIIENSEIADFHRNIHNCMFQMSQNN